PIKVLALRCAFEPFCYGCSNGIHWQIIGKMTSAWYHSHSGISETESLRHTRDPCGWNI
uniref:Uncharacterized protein n=1 Tax=Anopheles quadriannulatus TaxID=34691 RepID=A0A182XR40_ANOQN